MVTTNRKVWINGKAWSWDVGGMRKRGKQRKRVKSRRDERGKRG